ncbi:zinc finger BED domain-containing protein RICESLEEPER 2-like [Carya illinoinensis]|uniref:zinc finger BED domain-containing protein RICESLEEPER 2-like n=1 Tax=Carya illinoinensis TaxID=32201 RepID=UPI001C72110B|nr:zinc finger BED domain-containing protein RICESLEEPER 2-like [Carya illinoinensis]
MGELPFQIVDVEGFQVFCHYMEPRFQLPSRHTVANDVKKHYRSEKEKLRGFLAGQFVCLTTDCWTSIQNFNYIYLTCHFVDDNWTLHKKILKFCQIIDHKGETIGRALEVAIKEWELIRVVTCIVDNASSNDTALGYLKTFLREANKTILGGEYLHVRCAAHILNLIVSDGMKNLHDSIAWVRTAVRWVRSSPARLEKFKVVARSAGITSKKGLCTDLTTQWNSTFFMLEAAQEYKLAFSLLGEEDIQYVKYFEHEARLGKPMTKDWDVVKEELDEIIASSHTRLREMTLLIRAKYDKYWGGDFDRANMLLYIAIAIDPRFKVDGMVYGLGIAYGQAWAEHIASRVRETLDRLFDELTILRGGNITAPTPIPPPVPDAMTKKKRRMDWGDRMKGNPLTRSTTEAKSEIDRYFGLDLEPYVRDFDILAWWKVHAPKYPVLAQIARRSPIYVPDVIDYDHVNAEEEGDDAPGSGNVT